MNQSKTSYHFKITTSDEVMEVFGTVMSRTPEGIVLDLWCPEEPRLCHRITIASESVSQTVEKFLRDNLVKAMPFEKDFSIRYLPC